MFMLYWIININAIVYCHSFPMSCFETPLDNVIIRMKLPFCISLYVVYKLPFSLIWLNVCRNQRDIGLFILIEQTPNQVTEQINNFKWATQDTRATTHNQRAFYMLQSIIEKKTPRINRYFRMNINIAVIKNDFLFRKTKSMTSLRIFWLYFINRVWKLWLDW